MDSMEASNVIRVTIDASSAKGPYLGRVARLYHTDNGKEFINKVYKRWTSEHGAKFTHGSAYTPESQGQVLLFSATKRIITANLM